MHAIAMLLLSLTAEPVAIPRHFPHIRVAALAYAGNPMGRFERELLRTSLDLVVPNPKLLPAVHDANPKTPAVIYTNVSNLYRELLLDWLDYADAQKIDREAAFFHVAQPTPYRGMSASSLPVDWFWLVQREETGRAPASRDVTSAARDPKGGDLALPAVGRVTLGHPERFDEVRLTLTRPAAGWSVAWEYADGATWKTLDVRDETDNGRTSGRVRFEPPSDWRPTRLSNGQRLYAVRLVARGGVPAVATTITARDYTAGQIIPAFDAAADTNGDGYLVAEEYARRRAGHDARFRHESRLFYPYYGPNRFAVRPTAAVQGWAADYHRRFLRQHPLASGLFLDNTGGRPPLDGATVIESTASYPDEAAAVLAAVREAIAPRLLLANAGGHGPAVDRVLSEVPVVMEEFALRPLAHHYNQFRDVAATVDSRLKVAPMLVLDSLPAGGSPTDPRTQLATLAYYYLLADPERTLVMFYGGFEPASPWARHWVPAVAIDVGRPKQRWRVWGEGIDPTNPALSWQVFARDYENAFVLYKPLSYNRGQKPGTTDDATATTHDLHGRYRPVQADGTIGEATDRIRLRNGEGAILLRSAE